MNNKNAFTHNIAHMRTIVTSKFDSFFQVMSTLSPTWSRFTEGDYEETKQTVLQKREGDGGVEPSNYYVDLVFPPDETSLTYVYSGDNKYEKMIFLRPKEICRSPTIACRGPTHLALHWTHWSKPRWLQYAFAIISLNPNFLDKLIPGYRQKSITDEFEPENYAGIFRVKLWHFGYWETIIIDDYIPVFEGSNALAYCPALGKDNNEFWGPFLEKAMAKCAHSYEMIETGNPLHGLTTLTGAICECYNLHPRPDNIFHMLYTSCQNQSFMVAWRSDIEASPNRRFSRGTMDSSCSDTESSDNLYIILSITMLPIRGNERKLICIKYPYGRIPAADHDLFKRCGDDTDQEIMRNFKPGRSPRIRWIRFETFCDCFAGVIICSLSEQNNLKNQGSLATLSRNTLACLSNEGSLDDLDNMTEITEAYSSTDDKEKDIFRVQEAQSTVKVDTVSDTSPKLDSLLSIKQPSNDVASASSYDSSIDELIRIVSEKKRSNPYIWRPTKVCGWTSDEQETLSGTGNSGVKKHAHSSGDRRRVHSWDWAIGDSVSPQLSNMSQGFSERSFGDVLVQVDGSISSLRRGSSLPNSSADNKSDDSFDIVASDSRSRYHTISRRRSCFADVGGEQQDEKKDREAMLEEINTNLMIDMQIKSQRPWNQLIYQHGLWTSDTCGGSRKRESHSRNPRILFHVRKHDTSEPVLSTKHRSKRHVIVSLMQDYKQRSRVPTLLNVMGFCIYKVKSPDKDEKRSLFKLRLIGQVESTTETVEINGRFDLEPGDYYFVPYNIECVEGKFLVRILGESNYETSKQACVIS